MNSKETGRRRSNCRLAEEDQTELRIEIFQTFKQLYFSSHPWQLLHTAITCVIKSKFIKDSILLLRQHTILDVLWFLQSPLDPVFRAIYVLSRSRFCVCRCTDHRYIFETRSSLPHSYLRPREQSPALKSSPRVTRPCQIRNMISS